jgi:F-type H+-transporting ATPase subunit a
VAVQNAGPLEQFEIHPLIPIHIGGYDVSFTNSALVMCVAVALITIFMMLSMRDARLVPSRSQSVAEYSYEFVANMVRDSAGTDGVRYFPYIFSLFMFILVGNLIGLLPYSYAFTSQVIVTAGLAVAVFIAVTIVAFVRHGLHFFGFFFPEGAPVFMAPLLVPIEIISYLSRPFSLAIRLFANVMAGHTMLAVFASFVVGLGLFGFLPVLFDSVLLVFEVFIGSLQAYIFAVLACLYLHDALYMH